MQYKEFTIKVKECINFIKHCEELRNRLIEEYKYYKDEIDNEDYDDEDIKAILYGTLDKTERKCLKNMINFVDWYVVEYNRDQIERDRFLFYPKRTDVICLLLTGKEHYGVRKFYFYGWLDLFERCYKPMKGSYYKSNKEILVSKNFVILNKLYQEIKNI
jgi:hypothetical protein